jgi:hypothetical protein
MDNKLDNVNTATTTKRKSKFRWWKFWLVLLLLAGFVVYYLFFRPFSEGFREGFIVKLSKKGYVFKTWEGEMRMNQLSLSEKDQFYFSIADEKIADQINKTDKRKFIKLRYKQYLVTPFWRGDTKYFIDQLEILQDIPNVPQPVLPTPR